MTAFRTRHCPWVCLNIQLVAFAETSSGPCFTQRRRTPDRLITWLRSGWMIGPILARLLRMALELPGKTKKLRHDVLRSAILML
jgi:hypothetical protein